MATELEIKEWEVWVEKLFDDRREAMPMYMLTACDEYLKYREYRVLGGDIVKAAMLNVGFPSLTDEEIVQAQDFNERGFFGKRSIEYLRDLLKADALAAA